MPLPVALRRLTPDTLRHQPTLRGAGLRLGLVPPRVMHSESEGAHLRELAAHAHAVAEIGVYEGGSAVVLCEVLGPRDQLHLIDPFGRQPGALPAGWAGLEWATKAVVERARKAHDGPQVTWHVGYSHEVVRSWSAPIDLLFIDGDHLYDGVAQDWRDWHPHVAPGGHVTFHDARLGHEGGRGLEGPTQVVDEHVRTAAGWTVVAEVDRMVTVRRDP